MLRSLGWLCYVKALETLILPDIERYLSKNQPNTYSYHVNLTQKNRVLCIVVFLHVFCFLSAQQTAKSWQVLIVWIEVSVHDVWGIEISKHDVWANHFGFISLIYAYYKNGLWFKSALHRWSIQINDSTKSVNIYRWKRVLD